jgi:hypothetical protein
VKTKMQYFEGTLAVILSTLLLLLIIIISQGIRSKSDLLSSVEKDLKIKLNVLTICRQYSPDVNKMLREMADFLDSNGVRWCIIEVSSRKNGETSIENKSISNGVVKQVRYIRVVKISSEDTMYITIGLEE